MAKKDFSGKNQTKDTYTGDWVFHGGAWVTKKQRRKAIEDRKEARAYNAAIGNAQTPPVPTTATPPTTVPILTTPTPGEAARTTPMNPDLSLARLTSQERRRPVPPIPHPLPESAPETQIPGWWINQAIQNPTDPNQQFANVANALLPTLAPEDQRTLASYLAQNFQDVYGGYANVNFGAAPTQITDDIRKQYLSPQRAQTALNLLNRMKAASGAQNMGAGYDFLTNAVSLINQFTNSSGVMGRENYNQFANAVSSLVGQAGSNQDLAAYANLAQLFNLPKFSAGPIISNTPNTQLYS